MYLLNKGSVSLVCTQVPARGFRFILTCGDAEREVKYVLRARAAPRESHIEGYWRGAGWMGLVDSLGLQCGDVLTLTRPVMWSCDGSSRMSMTVGQSKFARQHIAASAAIQSIMDATCSGAAVSLPPSSGSCEVADAPRVLKQRAGQGCEPGFRGCSGSGTEVSVGSVRIVLRWTVGRSALRLTRRKAAALMPPDNKVPVLP